MLLQIALRGLHDTETRRVAADSIRKHIAAAPVRDQPCRRAKTHPLDVLRTHTSNVHALLHHAAGCLGA